LRPQRGRDVQSAVHGESLRDGKFGPARLVALQRSRPTQNHCFPRTNRVPNDIWRFPGSSSSAFARCREQRDPLRASFTFLNRTKPRGCPTDLKRHEKHRRPPSRRLRRTKGRQNFPGQRVSDVHSGDPGGRTGLPDGQLGRMAWARPRAARAVRKPSRSPRPGQLSAAAAPVPRSCAPPAAWQTPR
jgi:hypothetical protein